MVPLEVLPEHLLHAGGVRIRRDESGRLPADASLFEIVADFERRKIIEALEAAELEPDRGRRRLCASRSPPSIRRSSASTSR